MDSGDDLAFCLQRPDIFSYDDLLSSVDFVWFIITARLTGSCLKSIAGGLVLTAVWPVLYLWAVAGGAISGMRDYKPKTQKK